jgi:hypothetical protein
MLDGHAAANAADLAPTGASRWDHEAEALSDAMTAQRQPDDGALSSSDQTLADLRSRVVAMENIIVAMLARGPCDQRSAIHDMALFIRPLTDPQTNQPTSDAATMMDRLADRATLFARALA